MKIIAGILLWSFVFFSLPLRAADHNYSLILAEYGEDLTGEQTQTLVRYRFKAGQIVATQRLLTTRTLDLRYDLGPNLIYRKRFIITNRGDVIDLTTGRIIWKSDGDLVAVDRDSDSVIIRADRDTGQDIYAFDLNSFRYRRVQRPGLWAMPGVRSPGGQLSASGTTDEVEEWPVSGKISLWRPDGKEVCLGEFPRESDDHCSGLPGRPTFLWLDDRHLLTQQGNGNLVRVDITGKVEPLLTIPDVKTRGCGPQLRRDADNNIYYDDAWLIHVTESSWPWPGDRPWFVVENSYEPYLWQGNGNEFASEFRQDPAYGQKILHRGIEIGRWWSGSVVTAPGHIALIFGPVGSNLGYPEGVKVWSVENKKWTTITPKWLTAIIGWVED